MESMSFLPSAHTPLPKNFPPSIDMAWEGHLTQLKDSRSLCVASVVGSLSANSGKVLPK